MSWLSSITLILALLFSTDCSSVQHPTWSASLLGQWRQSTVTAPVGPCQPCQYILNIDHNQATFTIWNKNENSAQGIKQKYTLKRVQQDSQVSFVYKIMHFQGYLQEDRKQIIKVKVEIYAEDGVMYNYVVEAVNIALYIDDQQSMGTLPTIIKSIIFAIICTMLLPIKKSSLHYTMLQTHTRTMLPSLFLFAQTMSTIAFITAIIAIQYIYSSNSYIYKLIYYVIFGSCFLVFLLHTTFGIAILQNKINGYLERKGRRGIEGMEEGRNGGSALFKFGALILVVFGGIMGYPIALACFQKGVWYCYLSSFGIMAQLMYSYYHKKLPYPKFILMYSISVVYLALITDSYPVLNFTSLTFVQLALFNVFLGAVLVVSAWFLRKTGNLQNIADMFQLESKAVESTDGDSSKDKNFQNIKSDFEIGDKYSG